MCCAWIVLALAPMLANPQRDRTGAEPVVSAARETRERTPQAEARREQIARCLAIYYTRPVDADTLRPWSIMHGLIAYGDESEILSRGRRINAVEYLCANGIGNDRRLMDLAGGQLHLRVGVGVQGHDGQLLAMLAQSNVPREQPILVDRRQLSVENLIEYEQRGCRPGSELTFRLIGLSHYLDSDATWTSSDGQRWSIARLVREELSQPVNGAACGGTHRLMAISYAVAKRREQGHEFDKVWNAAADYIADYQRYTLSLQNPDGSFSTDWFRGRAADHSAKRRLYTTGHVLEWLVWSLPEERLNDEPVTRAVEFLTQLMLAAPGYELDVGPRGHGLRALRLYHEKMFGKPDVRQFSENPSALTNNDAQRRVQPSATPAAFPATPARPIVEQPIDRRGGIFGRRR